MTIEERVDSVCKWNNPGLREAVLQALRDQVEDCAKIADAETEGASTYQWQHAAEEIAENIRALLK